MIDEKKLIEVLSKNSIFEKITNAEGKNVIEIIKEQPQANYPLSDCIGDCKNCWKTKLVNEPKVGEWIPCEVDMPKERDSIFKKVKGTDKWSGGMFETISNIVQVTYEFETGERIVGISNTLDGKWKKEPTYKGKRIIAWKPLDEPYKGE